MPSLKLGFRRRSFPLLLFKLVVERIIDVEHHLSVVGHQSLDLFLRLFLLLVDLFVERLVQLLNCL